MRAEIVDATIWYAGAVAVMAMITVIAAALAKLLAWFANVSGTHLLRIIRFETARYWAQRMEREGLTVMQSEYRRMVAERNPKTLKDFVALDREDGKRIMREHMKDSQE